MKHGTRNELPPLKPRIHSPRYSIPVLLTVLHYLCLTIASSIPYHAPLFAFFFATLVLVPGYMVSRMIFHRLNIYIRLFTSFVAGVACVYAVLLLFAVFRWDIYYVGVVVPLITLVCAAGGLAGIPRFAGETTEEETDAVAVPWSVHILFVALAIFITLLIFMSEDPVHYSADSADHLAYLRTVARSHEAFPEENLYPDGGILTRDIRKGLSHSMWGTINVLTGRRDAVEIWPVVSVISSLFNTLALFCAGLLIFRSPTIGLLASFLLVFVYLGGLTKQLLITAAFSFSFGRGFSIAFLAYVIRYMNRRRGGYLLLAAASSFASAGTHIGHFMINVFILVYLSIASLIEGSRGRRWHDLKHTMPWMWLVSIGVAVPYLAMRYLRDYSPNNEIHTHLQGAFMLTENLYMLNPVVYFGRYGVLSTLTIFSVFILWRHSKGDRNLRLLLWGIIAVLLTLFNPLLAPIIMERISYLIMRFNHAVPPMIVSAYLLTALWNKAAGKNSLVSRGGAIVGWIVVVSMLGYTLVSTLGNFAYSRGAYAKSKEYSCRSLSALYAAINEKIPPGSVIISDPLTSYCIPAFTDQYIVCTNGQHSIPNDSTAVERILDCKDVFLPETSMSDIIRIMKKYGSEYIVVNGGIPSDIVSLYWEPNQEIIRIAKERFLKMPAVFNPLYSDDGVVLLKLREDYVIDHEDGMPLMHEFIGRRVPLDSVRAFTESGIDGIYIRGIRLGSESVERGKPLDVTIEWINDGERPHRRYHAAIRFDTAFSKGPLFNEYYSKIYRKILERRQHRRFRFSSGHKPLGGLFSPDKWPPLRIIEDRLDVMVPTDVAPGAYDISVKLLEAIQYPNYTLKDLLSDDDRYNGVVIGRVTVE